MNDTAQVPAGRTESVGAGSRQEGGHAPWAQMAAQEAGGAVSAQEPGTIKAVGGGSQGEKELPGIGFKRGRGNFHHSAVCV